MSLSLGLFRTSYFGWPIFVEAGHRFYPDLAISLSKTNCDRTTSMWLKVLKLATSGIVHCGQLHLELRDVLEEVFIPCFLNFWEKRTKVFFRAGKIQSFVCISRFWEYVLNKAVPIPQQRTYKYTCLMLSDILFAHIQSILWWKSGIGISSTKTINWMLF